MRVIVVAALSAFGAFAAFGGSACSAGSERPPASDNHGTAAPVTSQGTSRPCGWPASNGADKGTFTLNGDGTRLQLKGTPRNPSYAATYPVEGLVSMTVRLDSASRLVASCTSQTGPTACGDPPFNVWINNRNVEVRDIYGELILDAPAYEGPGGSSECALSSTADAGPTCLPRDIEKARAAFCKDVDAAINLQGIAFHVDCSMALDSVPTTPAPVPPAGPPVACYPLLTDGLARAETTLTVCGAEGHATVTNWGAAARAQMINGGACSVSPLVLDLDGSGLAFSSLDDGAMFDLLGNGVPVRASWPRAGIAFLAMDRNGDGSIGGANELFGNATGGGTYDDGFEALRELDANGDLRIDARDPAFSELVLWTDRDGNGVSSPSELSTLAEHGIKALELGAERIEGRSSLDPHGNRVPLVSRYVRTDGRTGTLADVFLRFRVR